MMCQCRIIHCNKSTTLVGDVDGGVGSACARAGGIWGISAFQFCCERKTAVKISPYFRIEKSKNLTYP